MSAVPPFPTRPDEVPHGVGLAALVDAYNRHQTEVLVRSRRNTEQADDELFAHALSALALLHALVDRLQAARWSTVRAALAEDVARAADVAAACALDGSEVAAGLRSWATGQVEAGLMQPWEYGVVDLMAVSIGGQQR